MSAISFCVRPAARRSSLIRLPTLASAEVGARLPEIAATTSPTADPSFITAMACGLASIAAVREPAGKALLRACMVLVLGAAG
jgi:uncharacterized membrane protein